MIDKNNIPEKVWRQETDGFMPNQCGRFIKPVIFKDDLGWTGYVVCACCGEELPQYRVSVAEFSGSIKIQIEKLF